MHGIAEIVQVIKSPLPHVFSRLLTLIAGFGSEVFTTADYFFWIPWLMPHVGGLLGAVLYYFMVEHHHPEPVD